MTTIQAAQLIYTRVESAYSPKKKDGFQTVYKTNTLSDAEVSAIEKRIQCFQPYQPEIRRQFFTLSSGMVVLTHTTQIIAHPEIIDKSSRRGAFIAHCLILEQAEFDKVGWNPFFVFDSHQFVTTAEEMVNRFGKATGVAPAKTIEISQGDSLPTCSWKGSEILKVTSFANQAEQLSKQGKSVFFLGQEQNINEILRIIFHLVPQQQRCFCTFDTCIDTCPVQPGSYWTVGSTRSPGGAAFIQVNTAEKRVISQVQAVSAGQDWYWGWLNKAGMQEIQTAIQHAPTAQILSAAFAEKRELNNKQLDENACQEFFGLYKEPIVGALKITVAKATSKSIAEGLCDYMYRTAKMPVILNIAAAQSIDFEYLSSVLTEYIFSEKPDLEENDWKILQPLAQKTLSSLLLYLSATFRKKIDDDQRKQALRTMDEEDFQRILTFLLDPIEPAHFVTRRFVELLVEDKRLASMDDEQFLNLVTAMVESHASNHLDALAGYVERLEKKSLSQLEKFMEKHAYSIPKQFEAAMMARREELGNTARFLGFFGR